MQRQSKWQGFSFLLLCLSSQHCMGYFISHPDCGFMDTQQFVNFDQATQLSQGSYSSVGVCNWGISQLTHVAADRWAGHCLQCQFVTQQPPRGCPAGYTPDRSSKGSAWMLAPITGCSWSSCLGLPCAAYELESQTATCGTQGVSRSCCPLQPYTLCCKALECSQTETVNTCTLDDKSLQPGQTATTIVYAVAAASTSCSDYSFSVERTCQSDQTLTSGMYYTSCTVQPVQAHDADGCAILPNYTFVRHATYSNSLEAVFNDNTPWHRLQPATMEAATADLVLMASRCDQAGDDCASFDALSQSSTLRSFIPMPDSWQTANNSQCSGTYVKQQQQPVQCPRLPGYVFIPGRTWLVNGTTDLQAAYGNSAQLAATCNEQGAVCAGFSNLQGLLEGSPDDASQVLAQLSQFTTTSCRGLFVKAQPSVMPPEVEALDQLLCGSAMYCQTPLQYSFSTSGPWVDVKVTLTGTLVIPTWLVSPNEVTLDTLPRLPALRKLQFTCTAASSMQGGLPQQLLSLLSSLQELSMAGCSCGGSLPEDLPDLAPPSLHRLDLSGNQLSGTLPDSWGSLQLSFLNLSSNALQGPVPPSWVGLPASPDSWSHTGRRLAGLDDVQALVDLTYNQLDGPVPRPIVAEACLAGSLQLQLDTGGYVSRTQRQMLLGGNPGMLSWSGDYRVAERTNAYTHAASQQNMCASYRHIIIISCLWGAFCLVLLSLAIWWYIRQQRQHNTAIRVAWPGKHQASSVNRPAAIQPPHAQQPPTVFSLYWSMAWVRLLVFGVRQCILLSDVALDVRVLAWLWADGSMPEAGVCLAFMLLAQVAVAIAVFAALFFPAFSSMLRLLIWGPPLLLATPVLAPILAVWNAGNASVPLLWWRYLELLEFAVVLFQAPAQAITQTAVYAKYSRMGGGMYLDSSLFLTSIALSLLDLTITAFKLARYKHGPWTRIRQAFQHLIEPEDEMAYISLDSAKAASASYGVQPPVRGESYLAATQQIPWNPHIAGAQGSGDSVGDAVGGAPASHGEALGEGVAETASSVTDVTSMTDLACYNHLQGTAPTSIAEQTHGTTEGAAGRVWSISMPMPPPQMSLLQQSSLRLAISTAMTASAAAAAPVEVQPVKVRRRVSRHMSSSGKHAGVQYDAVYQAGAGRDGCRAARHLRKQATEQALTSKASNRRRRKGTDPAQDTHVSRRQAWGRPELDQDQGSDAHGWQQGVAGWNTPVAAPGSIQGHSSRIVDLDDYAEMGLGSMAGNSQATLCDVRAAKPQSDSDHRKAVFNNNNRCHVMHTSLQQHCALTSTPVCAAHNSKQHSQEWATCTPSPLQHKPTAGTEQSSWPSPSDTPAQAYLPMPPLGLPRCPSTTRQQIASWSGHRMPRQGATSGPSNSQYSQPQSTLGYLTTPQGATSSGTDSSLPGLLASQQESNRML